MVAEMASCLCCDGPSRIPASELRDGQCALCEECAEICRRANDPLAPPRDLAKPEETP